MQAFLNTKAQRHEGHLAVCLSLGAFVPLC